MPVNAPVRLNSGHLALDIQPDLGCSISRLEYHRADGAAVELFRPMAALETDAFLSGCFALVPYSNRLFAGCLLARQSAEVDETCVLPPNRKGVRHPVHGVGWSRRWNSLITRPSHAEFSYEHEPDEHWPFAHRCTQTVTLDGVVLRISLRLENLAQSAMPAGGGFHPFFETEADTTVTFTSTAVWEQDEQGMPSCAVPVESSGRFDFSEGQQPHRVEMNHCYRNVGPVYIRRPACGLRLRMLASQSLDHLAVYRPAYASWICLEPVSHATGAFSLQSMNSPGEGARYLEPGASMDMTMEIAVTELDQSRNLTD